MEKELEVYLIRHAECEINLSPHIIAGRANHSQLTENGIKQAHSLNERLRNEKIIFDEIYISPAIRTKETAKIGLPNYEDAPKYIEDDLQELDRGIWVGMKRIEVFTPELLGMLDNNAWEHYPPKGESPKKVSERMNGILSKIIHRNNNGKIAIVTHGNAIKCLISSIIDSNKNKYHKREINNTSITKLKFENGTWKVLEINDYSHIN